MTWDLIPGNAKLVVMALDCGSEIYITICRGGVLILPSKDDWIYRNLPAADRLRFKELHMRVGNHFEYVYVAYFDNWFDTVMMLRDNGIHLGKYVKKAVDGGHRGLDYRSSLIMKVVVTEPRLPTRT